MAESEKVDFEYAVCFEDNNGKQFTDEYKYECTARLYYEQIKDVAKNVRLIRFVDGNRTIISE